MARRHRSTDEGTSYWLSYSDMMAALLLIFVLIISLTMMQAKHQYEEKEQELLDAVSPAVCTAPDWQVALSEWKLANNVRQITEYQARRFAKYILSLNT